jgi:uncharacterized membrane protein
MVTFMNGPIWLMIFVTFLLIVGYVYREVRNKRDSYPRHAREWRQYTRILAAMCVADAIVCALIFFTTSNPLVAAIFICSFILDIMTAWCELEVLDIEQKSAQD